MCGLFIFCLVKKMNFTAASQTLSKNFFPAVFLLSFLSFFCPLFNSPNRCHLLWCSDIFWKILMPKPYRPCMLLKHKGNRLLLGSPQRRISSRTFGVVAAALSALGCAALSSSGHLQAPWYCTLTLQQPYRLQRLLPDRGCAGVKGAL